MIRQSNSFSPCLVIGNDSLTIKCAEKLLLHGYAITFISSLPAAKDWSHQKGIPCFNNPEDYLLAELSDQSFDYLFSIVCHQILPPTFLKQAKKLAINYHDSLLPRYAGWYATSWAIIQGETKHGISWHIMSDQVDAGDILLQNEISIDSQETTFSLNLKCHQQALTAFEKLISLLAAGDLVQRPQDLRQRTYFSRYRGLPQGGLIVWDSDAEPIDRLCRALDFGSHHNPLGSVKFKLGNEFYIVSHCQLKPSSNAFPGTIIEINEQLIRVATRSQDICITDIFNAWGEKLSTQELIAKHPNMKAGFIIPDILQPYIQSLHQDLKEATKQEEFWVKQWMETHPLDIPFFGKSREPYSENPENTQKQLISSNNLHALISKFQNKAETEAIVLTLVLTYLFRLNNTESFSIALLSFNSEYNNSSFFSQWLPLTAHFQMESNFLDALSEVKINYQHLTHRKPFQKDVFLRYSNLPDKFLPVQIALSNSDLYSPLEGHPLTWVIHPNDPKLSIYFSKSLSKATQHLVHHFEIFLNSLVNNPSKPIKNHSLLSNLEYKKILIEWNNTKKHYQKTLKTHQWFEQKVEKNPHKIALIFGKEALTYFELNQKANQLARYILDVSQKTHQRIAVFHVLSAETVITLLAILKSGNTYVPLDPHAPALRIQEIIADCQPSLIVTHSNWITTLPTSKVKTLILDEQQSVIESMPKDNIHLKTDQAAYVIYTSGSTGKPKGVIIAQQALVNFLMAMQVALTFHEKEILLAMTPITFDISGLEIYLPLVTGAQLVLVDQAIRLRPHEIVENLALHRITILQATPAVWQMLVNIGWKNDIGLKMLCGGEGLSTTLAVQLKRNNAPLWNLYGPTETTIWSTYYQVDEVDTQKPLVCIGKPILNTQVYVLDKNNQPVPPGINGLLHIAGDGLAVGYLNKPELTAQSFMANPFVQDGSLMYNSGDIVKQLEDGTLEFVTRSDYQIKLRGFRIELGEIEACLLEYSGIKQAIVVPKALGSGELKLVTYLTWSGASPLDRKKLVKHLKNRLFEHLVPSYFVILDQFPLNINGKINKKALPLPTHRDLHDAQNFVLPSSKEEKLLSEIWSEVLSVPLQEIGIHDNFFELGGYSLSGAQLMARISAQCFIKLDIRDLFENPTVHQLTKIICNSQEKTSAPPILMPVDPSQPQPLSANQNRIWFLNALQGHSAVYNITAAWELRGDLNITILNQAITDLIERQGVLRTLFLSIQGKGQQILKPGSPIPFQIEIEENPEISAETMDQILKKWAAEPFNLNYGSLFRFKLLKSSPKQHILFICLHHLIADGWSFGILYRELSLMYLAHYHHKPLTLSALPIQYIDFCVWKNKVDSASLYQPQKEYWKKKLFNLPALSLPTDFPRPTRQTYQGNTLYFHIPIETVRSLREYSQKNGITLFATLLSIFALWLSRYAHQDDFAIGIPIANRNLQLLENLIGFFINTLVIRFDKFQDLPLIDFIKLTQNNILEAHANSDVPFEKVIDALHTERDLSRSPLFQVMFTLNNTISDSLHFPNVTAKQIDIPGSYAHLEITCFLEEKNDMISGCMEYNTDLFSEGTIQRLINNYLSTLAEIAHTSEIKITQATMLSPEEQKTLLIDWNNTTEWYPTDKNIVDFFEEQAKEHSAKIALIVGDEKLTYDQLNNQANQLAHAIHRMAILPNSYIIVYLPRSIQTIVCFLAILKSGHAYIPVDVKTPPLWIQEILQDSRAAAVLTTDAFEQSLNKIPNPYNLIVVNIDKGKAKIASEKISDLKLQRFSSIAYALYTSGSTGKPKGVQVKHSSLVNLIGAMHRKVYFTEYDVLLAITPLTFDLSVPDLYLPLLTGGSFVLADETHRFSPQHIIADIRRYGVTLMQATPTTWQMLLDSGWRNESRIKIICGGEGLNTDLAMKLKASGAPCWNFYGPTETTVWSLCHKIESIDPTKAYVAIGRPLANTRVYVLDSKHRLCPMGVPGELYIGGAGVAYGYLNQQELTQQRFLPDPFSNSDQKLYKTGDWVMWSPEGEMYFLNRIDNQIKIRGHRIEVEAIENALMHYPGVHQCIVLDKSPDNKSELTAYLMLTQDLTWEGIRNHLSHHLPTYMIPTYFVVLEKFPLTSTGKIDKKQLPLLTQFRYLLPATQTISTEIMDEHEKIIADIIKRLLYVNSINTESNLFDLGMHSLLLVQFVHELSQSLQREITVIDVFSYPSVKSLAAFINKNSSPDSTQIDIQTRITAKKTQKTIKKRYETV